MSHWEIQVKCSCAGGSIGKIQIQLYAGGSRSGAAGSAAYAGRSTGRRGKIKKTGSSSSQGLG
jgi:hypothetical protein